MSYAKSEPEYIEAYKDFKAVGVQPAIEYFEKNWHSIRKLWAAFGKNRKLILERQPTTC